MLGNLHLRLLARRDVLGRPDQPTGYAIGSRGKALRPDPTHGSIGSDEPELFVERPRTYNFPKFRKNADAVFRMDQFTV
jgi:hypothetical protein